MAANHQLPLASRSDLLLPVDMWVLEAAACFLLHLAILTVPSCCLQWPRVWAPSSSSASLSLPVWGQLQAWVRLPFTLLHM